MKAKEIFKKIETDVDKGLEAIGKQDIRDRVRPRLARHFIGIYFEKEIIDRLSKRYRGEVPDSAAWSFKKETYSWAHKLADLLKVEHVDNAHLDRIVDVAIIAQNAGSKELRQAESAALAALKKNDIKVVAESAVDIAQYTKEPEPVKLGDALGQK